MTTRVTPQKFLEDFTKDMVAHPGNRPELIKGYAKLMEMREENIVQALPDEHLIDEAKRRGLIIGKQGA